MKTSTKVVIVGGVLALLAYAAWKIKPKFGDGSGENGDGGYSGAAPLQQSGNSGQSAAQSTYDWVSRLYPLPSGTFSIGEESLRQSIYGKPGLATTWTGFDTTSTSTEPLLIEINGHRDSAGNWYHKD